MPRYNPDRSRCIAAPMPGGTARGGVLTQDAWSDTPSAGGQPPRLVQRHDTVPMDRDDPTYAAKAPDTPRRGDHGHPVSPVHQKGESQTGPGYDPPRRSTSIPQRANHGTPGAVQSVSCCPLRGGRDDHHRPDSARSASRCPAADSGRTTKALPFGTATCTRPHTHEHSTHKHRR